MAIFEFSNVIKKRGFKLGEEQCKALSLIKNFIKSDKDIAFSLCGSAGTGKTTLEKEIIKYLDSEWINYCLCAPTHKAALVMRQTTGMDAITLHKLLALSPNVEILDLDFRELQFKTSKVVTCIPRKGVIICDEASMINDDLFELLLLKCKDKQAKIIFISDSKQLNPVKSRRCSKVYSLPSQFELKHIYRQDSESALTPILQTLRLHKIGKLDTLIKEEGSLIVKSSMAEFLNAAKIEFQCAIETRDILHTKIAAYTNSRVALHNKAMRSLLWNDNEEYHKGEFLTAYENCDFEGEMFYNSMDYIIDNEPKITEFELPYFPIKVEGYTLSLYDSYDKITKDMVLLSMNNPTNTFKRLAETLEGIRYRAIESKRISSFRASQYWRQYYKLLSSFATPVPLIFENRVVRKQSFAYGYACTTHRLQGSTYEKIFVDMKNINSCTEDIIKQQLQYVALSRTRTDAYIFQ